MPVDLASLRVRPRVIASGRRFPSPISEFHAAHVRNAEALLAEPFTGVTNDGTPEPGLFSIQRTGVSTRPIQEAAAEFLAALDAEQRSRATFPIDSDAWRRWSNISPCLMRHGVDLENMTPEQREKGLALLAATLSARGFEAARDVMRLNETISEITGRAEEYGEWVYWLSLMGTPSPTEPWGWQIDGHHLIVNGFVLGDQVVMTPTFMGSEPVEAREGKFKGTRVFVDEEADGLALMRSLTAEQRRQATLGETLPGDVFTTAFRDNFELRYDGVRFGQLTTDQQARLLALVEVYVGKMRPDHAAVKMAEARAYLDRTVFAWIGACEEDSVFYYRIHSPVLLIEFDHQRGLAMDNDEPSRNHIHTVVRTPNGNDYGKDLLRQHHARFHPA
jgi:hypothetical protein